METREKIRKKQIVKVILITILLVLSAVLIGFAFARYITSLNGNTQAPIARWNFNVTAGSSQNLNIDLADTRLANDTTEVDRTKVAPGTKGALALNIDASGSQVSLKYDIDLTLTQIPENLIFYSDSTMENAIYKENGTIHLDGYFEANENNKTETKTLYWQWAMETGSTQAEIDANDLLDSAWMGDSIILGIQATGQQVIENPTEGQYAVTFDANGGTLQGYGNSSQATKMVTYGETYGNLPIPTREGYTFMGWNGKNIINKSQSLKEGIKNETSFAAWASPSFGTEWVINNFEPNKQYSISYDLECIDVPEFDSRHSANLGLLLYSNNSDKTVYPTIWTLQEHYVSVGEKLHFNKTFTTPSNVNLAESKYVFNTYTNRYLKDGVGVFSSVIISNLQLEEGPIATTYEPYYITESTQVVQNKNHTLTAIWEKE